MNATRLTLWVVAAAAAVGITTAAVTVANASDNDSNVLTQDDVSRELGLESTSPSTPQESPPASVPAGDPATFERTPGRVVVMCDGDQVWLVSWSPNPGYRVDDVVRGWADQVAVEFESDSADDVIVTVRCENGQPVATDIVEPDDHGGDRDDDRDDDHGGDDHGGDDHDDDDDDRSGSNSGRG